MNLTLVGSTALEHAENIFYAGFQDVGHYLLSNVAIAIFVSLGLGYMIGKIKIKSFTVGSTVGTLLVGLLISFMFASLGKFEISGLTKSIFFTLFIFTIGYEVGPSFFGSLKKTGIKLVILSTFFSVAAFVVCFALFKIFKVNPGEGAGIVAGALTQSAVLGTASETIKTVMSGSAKTEALNQLPIAYAITYVFGTVGVIIFVKNIAPKLLGVDIKEATKAKIEKVGFKEAVVNSVVSAIKARAFSVGEKSTLVGKKIGDIEKNYNNKLSFELLFRKDKLTDFTTDTVIEKGDILTLLGDLTSMVEIGTETLTEISDEKYLKFAPQENEVVLTKDFKMEDVKSLSQKGVVLISAFHDGKEIKDFDKLEKGDIIKIVGPKKTITKVISMLGYAKDSGPVTDVSFLSIGIVLGLLIGALCVKVGSIPITLGGGGGALVGGLIFGWYKNKHGHHGLIPAPTRWFLKSVGLNLFISVIGLSAGSTFLVALKQMGWMVLVIGVLVTLLPHILSVFFGRYVLKIDPVDILGGLCGAGTCTAALNGVIDETGSSIFAMGYTPAYAVGNIFLTVLGPLLVSVLM